MAQASALCATPTTITDDGPPELEQLGALLESALMQRYEALAGMADMPAAVLTHIPRPELAPMKRVDHLEIDAAWWVLASLLMRGASVWDLIQGVSETEVKPLLDFLDASV
jgi:hypothetical protein